MEETVPSVGSLEKEGEEEEKTSQEIVRDAVRKCSAGSASVHNCTCG
jgi:hypothetical protein